VLFRSYADPGKVEIFLNDYDRIERENIETSLLLSEDNVGHYKTRACGNWLEKRGFQTKLIERPFDGNFRRRSDEPGLVLCGFDSNPARRDLGTAQFLRVVESGLGGTANNFDTISLHTYPNPRHASELWPDFSPAEISRREAHQERVARENPAYARIGGDECGRFDLAGKSIAVPFVGATAATLLWRKRSACSMPVRHTPISKCQWLTSKHEPRVLQATTALRTLRA